MSVAFLSRFRILLLTLIKYMILPFGFIYSIFKKSESIRILMYHRINDSVYKEMSVKEKNFVWQMAYLKKRKYNILSMGEVARLSGELSRQCEKCVVLTFDDGYEDFLYNAMPILEKHNVKATLYIVPGYVETNRVYWWDEDLGQSRLMNWQQINHLSDHNFIELGSHTMNHLDLDRVSEVDFNYELQRSKEVLLEKTGVQVNHFSYPRGIYNKQYLKMIPQYYDTAVLIYDGEQVATEYLCKLERTPIQRSDTRLLFIAKIKGWLDIEKVLRNFIRKGR